jgi:hypothetical protein
MSLSARLTFIVIWLVSLVVVGGIVSGQTHVQQRDPGPIISGADIGFRPEGWNGKARTGTFMVRINGEWIEAQDVVKSVHATTK